MKNLNGKFAVVTGSGQGIGASIVEKFLEEDAAGIAMLDYNESTLFEKASKLDPSGLKLLPIECNVSNKEQVQTSITTCLDKFGTIDILVNNAGITCDSMFHKMTEEQWDSVISVNLDSLFYLCKEVVPIMRKKQYGKIVNISSTSALGNIGQANYCSTKAAVQGFTAALAKELGTKGITVNAVAPGFVETEMLASVPEKVKESWIAGLPMKRLGLPEEIASAVCFFSSDESSWVTGETLFVSGGGRT